MKRLLLGPALALPLILGLCHLRTPEIPQLPRVPEVIREIPLDDFNQFPPVKAPAIAQPETPRAVPHRPHVRHAGSSKVRHAPARPSRMDPVEARPDPADRLPPQQGPICIFPLSMIPNCTPQVAGQ